MSFSIKANDEKKLHFQFLHLNFYLTIERVILWFNILEANLKRNFDVFLRIPIKY